MKPVERQLVGLYLRDKMDDPLAFIAQGGLVIAFVYYPYRREADGYMTMRGRHNIHCLQCESDLPNTKLKTRRTQDKFTAHIIGHHRRKGLARRLSEVVAVRVVPSAETLL